METLLILGKSGVGKTSLLHILSGILKPKTGEVFIGDQSLYELRGSRLDKFRGRNIGIVFQKPHFVKSINAIDNLLLTQKISGCPVNKSAALNLLSRLNIDHRKDAQVYQMSQGEQQRLSIARALINSPKVIFADEPTSALDDEHCNEVIKLLEERAKEANASLVVVTHDNRLKTFFHNQIVLS